MQTLQLVRDIQSHRFQYATTYLKESVNTELLVENIAAGVCGTDFEIANAARKDIATILGHEGIGLIVKNFNKENGFNVGDIVVYNPVSILDQDRILGHSIDGIFCKKKIISTEDLKHGHILKIPGEYQPWYGCLLEPLAVAIFSEEILLKHCEPQTVLILGTGAIAHVIAAYYLRKNTTVFMTGNNKSRLNLLKENKQFGIQYEELEQFLSFKNKFDVVFSCAKRAKASQYFECAKELANPNTVISLINGFNDELFVDVKEQKALSLNQIRRNNCSGATSQIYEVPIRDKSYFLTGQRGANQQHFQQALRELTLFPEHYQKLVARSIEFSELADLLNGESPLDLLHFGKILVKIKDNI
jgi:threonine dehydrogenase-like Zn-dependent dehydrogenase